MNIQLVNRTKGLPPGQVVELLSTGWICISDVAVDVPKIAMPGQPEIMGGAVDVWIPPMYGATMPQVVVAQGLIVAAEKGNDIITLDNLAKGWFGKNLRDLQEALTPPKEEGGGPEGERVSGPVFAQQARQD